MSQDDDNSSEKKPAESALRLVRFRVDPNADLCGLTFRLQSAPTLRSEEWLDMESDADVTFFVHVDDE